MLVPAHCIALPSVRAVTAMTRFDPDTPRFRSGVAARVGFPNHEAIAAAKAAVAALAVSAAASGADVGVRINCVHPALTRSGLSMRWLATAEQEEKFARVNPSGRIGEGDDTAAAIAYLPSDAASWITGQELGVDGGQSRLWRAAS